MAAILADTIRDIQRTTLPNGVRVVTELMPHVRSVSLGVWIASGSRRETGEENGISHFIEHMVFKGTANRSAEDIARSVDSIGGGLDAFTSKELVSYNTKVLDEHMPIAFDVLSDLVLNPLFREEDIEKEKGVILEEIKMEVDNPEYLIHEIFSSNFWKDHPLGKPILGTKDTVKLSAREYFDNGSRQPEARRPGPPCRRSLFKPVAQRLASARRTADAARAPRLPQ
jgi:predicted Zn-dependent peptidase